MGPATAPRIPPRKALAPTFTASTGRKSAKSSINVPTRNGVVRDRHEPYFAVASESRASSTTSTASEVRVAQLSNGSKKNGGPRDFISPGLRRTSHGTLEFTATTRSSFLARRRSNGLLANGEASRSPRKKTTPSSPFTTPESAKFQRKPASAQRSAQKVRVSSAKRKRIDSEDDSDDDGVAAARQEFTEAIRLPVSDRGDDSENDEEKEDEEASARPMTDPVRPLRPNGRAIRKRAEKEYDESAFDALVYQQEGAQNSHPIRPDIRRRSPPPRNAPAASAQRLPLFLPINPHIHWVEEKAAELVHGGRRRNRKTDPTAVQSGAAKIKEARFVRGITIAAAAKEGERANAQTVVHGRRQDFGQVPEDELPDAVKANPAWLRATAWMRECREKSLQMSKDRTGR